MGSSAGAGTIPLSLHSSPVASRPPIGQKAAFIHIWFNLYVVSILKEKWLELILGFRKIWFPFKCQIRMALRRLGDDSRISSPVPINAIQRIWSVTFFWLKGLSLILIKVSPHLILCLTITIIYPFIFLWRLVSLEKIALTWEKMLVVSCISMCLDPFFFYIPIIDEKNSCLGMDKKLSITLLVFRSIADLAFLLHIVHLAQILDKIEEVDLESSDEAQINEMIDRRTSWLSLSASSSSIIINFVAILPVTQVTIMVVFFRLGSSSGYVYKIAIVNIILLLQLLARAHQIYNCGRHFKMLGKWTNSAFNVYLYIIAGHVLGALWYLFSIQRETFCWHQACKNTAQCKSTYYCEDTKASTNTTLLQTFCPTNPQNATLFDFGIFLEALQSGNTGRIGFSTKFFYTFWWGIRNLSNFGTNLETSSYVWENCFTVLISIIGLLLFIYLMGNVQTYILWESTKQLEDEVRTIKTKYEEIDTWISNNNLSHDLKTYIMERIKQLQVVERNYIGNKDEDVNFTFFSSIVDEKHKRELLEQLLQYGLRTVRDLIDYQHEINLFNNFEYVSLEKDTLLTSPDERIPCMLVIMEGQIMLTDRTNRPNWTLGMGEVFGIDLFEINDFSNMYPQSNHYVFCATKVEAMQIDVDRLRVVICEINKLKLKKESPEKRSSISNESDSGELNNLQNKFEDITASYDEADQKLDETSMELGTNNLEEIEDGDSRQRMKVMMKEKEVLEWVSRNNLPDDLQTEIKMCLKITAAVEENLDDDVDVEYISTVLPESIFKSTRKYICMSVLNTVQVLENADEYLLNCICDNLEPVIFTENSIIGKEDKELDMMMIVVEGELVDHSTTGGHGNSAKKFDCIGERLFCQALFPDMSLPDPPLWGHTYVCVTKVEAFVLTRESLQNVLSECGATYMRHILLPGSDGKVNDKVTSTAAPPASTTVEQRLDQIIQLQLRQQDEMANQGKRLDEMAAFLATLGYPSS